MIMKYKAGKQSSIFLKKIVDLEERKSKIVWNNEKIRLAKVISKESSTSASVPDDSQKSFKSRNLIFKKALKALQPDNKEQRIALCGMGGVGKTTMMEHLKKTLDDSEMFYWVVKVTIGKITNSNDIQDAVAEKTGGALDDTTKDARSKRLRQRFEVASQDGERKILVILDDIWEKVELKDIGLSPLPKGFKLLLTSRYEAVCAQMKVETNSIFRINVLNYVEAKTLFFPIVGLSDGEDLELHMIGEDIVKRCGGLPIAINTIALTLRGEIKDAWKVALSRLQRHDLTDLDDIVQDIFEMSYNHLKIDDDKAMFLLSGLFPHDFDIPIENLMRYGWGLKLFNKVYTIGEARRRTNTSVHKLIRSNLLTKSDCDGCVKMHDLVRDFVLSSFSKTKQASIVDDKGMSEWLEEDANELYERILVRCTGLSDFPIKYNSPNLRLLKLMDGDKRFKFPKEIFERIEYLEVMAYEKMNSPLLSVIPQYSTKLRTLCLHSCPFVYNLSLIGDLINLEILSFAHSYIEKL